MKRLWVVWVLVVGAVLVLAIAGSSQALPEYSAQTGEPCATCHISPSGGGLRTPRGQAWVGSGRPAAVPPLEKALAVLGVRLRTNAQDFIAAPGTRSPAPSMPVTSAQAEKVRAWLRAYEGN
jgi:mono/diheme cytochrome c family protein